MAIFLPSLDYIKKNIKPKPTDGELYLLEELLTLSDDYIVYFQPFLNGKNPDIIILKENYGVVIIEVKDYDLDNYSHKYNKNDSYDYGVFKAYNSKEGKYYKTNNPFEQVVNYKDMLFDMHLPLLGIQRELNPQSYGVIKSCLFFYKSSKKQIEEVISDIEKEYGRIKFNYAYLFGIDSNFIRDIKNLLLFEHLNEELTNHIKLQLKPSIERREQDEIPVLSEEQEKLSISQAGAIKIRGVSGSGKSLVLAKRALNAYERGKSVLILTYNITLRHHIRDDISKFKTYNRNCFFILNIHEFMSLIYNQLKEKFGKVKKYSEMIDYVITYYNKSYVSDDLRFETILIDEVQDFEYDWLDFIEQEILIKKEPIIKNGEEILYGEYVLFGDPKQKIYSITLDNKEINTNVDDDWVDLKKCYRLQSNILDLALNFQETFMKDSYNIDYEVKKAQQTEGVIQYYSFNKSDLNLIYDNIKKIYSELSISLNDIAVIYEKVDVLRDLESFFNKDEINCTTTFENNNQFNELKQKYGIDENYNLGPNGYELKVPLAGYDKDNDENLNKFILKQASIRKLKKCAFYMNRGTIKLSTIHSFKGWEIDTLFLILDYSEKNQNIDELIYTAITRCKRNLIIIDLNNNKYSQFFKNNIL